MAEWSMAVVLKSGRRCKVRTGRQIAVQSRLLARKTWLIGLLKRNNFASFDLPADRHSP
jgi:hypothetical protein